MARFTNFKDWKTGRKPMVEDAPQVDSPKIPGNAELLALIEELGEKRNAASRAIASSAPIKVESLINCSTVTGPL